MSEPEKPQPDELREKYSDIVPPLAPPDVFDPVIEAYKKDVDRTLLRESLKRTPEERVLRMQSAIDFLDELRAAGRRARDEEVKRKQA